jgi:hypothetical protein
MKMIERLNEKIECLYYKIKRASPYHNIKNGIQNLTTWFPVIWKNRDWDFAFIWIILHKKLELMEREIRINGHHTNNKRDANQIKLCVNLIKRLMDDNYHENVFIHHDIKWGETHMVWNKTDKPGESSLEIKRDNVKTKEDKLEERKQFRILSTNVEKQKQQDIEYLFNYMAKHIQCWWD